MQLEEEGGEEAVVVEAVDQVESTFCQLNTFWIGHFSKLVIKKDGLSVQKYRAQANGIIHQVTLKNHVVLSQIAMIARLLTNVSGKLIKIQIIKWVIEIKVFALGD